MYNIYLSVQICTNKKRLITTAYQFKGKTCQLIYILTSMLPLLTSMGTLIYTHKHETCYICINNMLNMHIHAYVETPYHLGGTDVFSPLVILAVFICSLISIKSLNLIWGHKLYCYW